MAVPQKRPTELTFNPTTVRGMADFLAREIHADVLAKEGEIASAIFVRMLKFVPSQVAVLELLEDGPATPVQLAIWSGKKSLRSTLLRLQAAGKVRQVKRGVWEKVTTEAGR